MFIVMKFATGCRLDKNIKDQPIFDLYNGFLRPDNSITFSEPLYIYYLSINILYVHFSLTQILRCEFRQSFFWPQKTTEFCANKFLT